MNCRLAYEKGQAGQSVEWTGAELTITPEGLTATVKEAIIVDIRMGIDEFDKVNKIRLKDLHTFTGK